MALTNCVKYVRLLQLRKTNGDMKGNGHIKNRLKEAMNINLRLAHR